jgi:hypothetical protein
MHGYHQEEGRGDDISGHGGMASQRQWKKGGWLQKTHRNGFFGEENWEGGGPQYKPIWIMQCDKGGFTFCFA